MTVFSLPTTISVHTSFRQSCFISPGVFDHIRAKDIQRFRARMVVVVQARVAHPRIVREIVVLRIHANAAVTRESSDVTPARSRLFRPL